MQVGRSKMFCRNTAIFWWELDEWGQARWALGVLALVGGFAAEMALSAGFGAERAVQVSRLSEFSK